MRDNTPWAANIRATFTDPAMQDAVDDFLATTVQPHVTKLEQQTAGLTEAKALYDDLQSDPTSTYVALTQELFGDDAAEAVVAALQPGDEKPAETPENDGSQLNLDDETREVLDELKAKRRQKEYDNAIEQFRLGEATDPEQAQRGDIVPKLFHPFVAGSGGDLEAAYGAYKQWLSESKQTFGDQSQTGDLNPDEVPDLPPPNTLGKGDAGATTAPPVQPQYRSIGDAIDDVWSDLAVGAPPVVGSV